MTPIEQRVRESLHARAEDAEPTPYLYRGVQDRIARRRRLKLMAWVPAGAAALGVAIAIPLLLTGGPEVPNIEDFADRDPQSTAATPDRAVIYDGEGGLEILDLRDGSVTDSGAQSQPPEGGALGLAVPAGDRGDDPAWIVMEQAPGTEPTWNIFRPGVVDTIAAYPGVVGDGGMAVSDDGGWVAYLATPGEADGYVVTVASTVMDDGMEIHTVGNVGEDARVLDWGGPTDGTPDVASEILLATANGTVTSFEVDWTDGVPTAVTRENVVMDAGPVLAASLDHVRSEGRAWSRYQLEQRGDERHVRFVEAMTLEPRGELDVTYLVGDADPADLWLDAWGDATLLGDGTAVWLLRHDGDGDFATPVALPEGTVRAALVGKDLPPPVPDPQPAPTPDRTPPDEEGDGGVVDEVQEVELPGAVVVTDADAVVLRRADGSELDLLRYPAPPEGEGANLEAAVRPGSTPDDLTVVVARTSEGFTDLRWIEVVGGEVRDPVVLEGGYAPASATDTGVRLDGLAWTPDGSKLLWLERRDDGTANLRSIGWSDGPGTGDTATDNASFEVPGGLTASLVDVVDAGGGRLVARFTHPDDDQGWYRWVLEVGGDGALAVPGSAPELVTSPVSQGRVAGLAGADEESRPTWLLIAGFDGPRLVADPFGEPRDVPVPAEVMPDDGLPFMWVHRFADGALVGGADQTWFVDAAGEANSLGDAVDADPVR